MADNILDAAHPHSDMTTVIVMLGETTLNGVPLDPMCKVQSFDPLTNQWRTLERSPKALLGFAVCASGSSLYLAGGRFYLPIFDHYINDDAADQYRGDMWRYDSHSNSWLWMAPMNEPRYYFSLVMLDGCVFAVGGRGSKKSRDSMEKYDPHTDSWQLMESVGVEAHYDSKCCNVVALDGHLYFIGGAPGDNNTPGGQVAKYNPKTSVWTQLAPLQIPRDSSAACVLNGKIYVTGGDRGEDFDPDYGSEIGINTTQCYNPQNNQWTLRAPMLVGRHSHSAVAENGKIYVVGGQGDRAVDEIECYCEETGTWETVGSTMRYPHLSRLKGVSVRVRTHDLHLADEDDELSEWDEDEDEDEDEDGEGISD